MAISPHTLERLYAQGILDHVPYELCTPAPANGSQYLNMAQQGAMYNAYNNSSDSFVRRTPAQANYSIKDHAFGDGVGVGRDVDWKVVAYGEEGKSFRQDILDAAKSTKEGLKTMPTVLKGLLSAGILGATLVAVLRGKCKPSRIKI